MAALNSLPARSNPQCSTTPGWLEAPGGPLQNLDSWSEVVSGILCEALKTDNAGCMFALHEGWQSPGALKFHSCRALDSGSSLQHLLIPLVLTRGCLFFPLY